MGKTFADFGIDVPRGARGPEVYTTCPQCSATRKKKNARCLSVNIDKGAFFCSHCSWAGGLMTGVGKNYSTKVYTKPAETKTNLPPAVIDYFEKRKISKSILLRNKIGYEITFMPDEGAEVGAITFPYFKDGVHVNTKYRSGRKGFKQVAGAEKVLYGLDDVTGDMAIFVEGEGDKLSLEVAGYTEGVSVPDGAPPANSKSYDSKFDFLENCKDVLSKLKKIVIAVDNDPPGKKLSEELIRRLGPERCWRVEWPEGCKDANEVLVRDGVMALAECIERARPFPVKGIFEVNDISEDIDRLYDGELALGATTGWWSVSQYYTVRPGELSIVTGIPSHGKAKSLDTLIPTPTGWTTMGEIRAGDEVFDENGRPCRVIAATEVMYGRDCYEMEFSDGTKVVCDAEHQWFTISDKARRSAYMAKIRKRLVDRPLRPKGTDQTHKRTFPGVVTTREIAGSLWAEDGKRANHRVPVSGALELSSKPLPLDPRMLGIWLGDGSTLSPAVTTPDPEIKSYLEHYASKHGLKVIAYGKNSKRTAPTYSLTRVHPGLSKRNPFIDVLRKVGVWGNKHIPAEYLRGSISQRLELLQGLLDTDGSVTTYGRCEFGSTRKALADGVYELVASLGWVPVVIEGRAKLNGEDHGPFWRVTFTPDKQVFTVKRKADRIIVKPRPRLKHRSIVRCDRVPSVPVRCIQVDSPSSLYLCTKAFIPTHNSSWVDSLMVNLSMNHDWRFAIFSPENQPLQRHAAKILQQYVERPFSEGHLARMSIEEREDAKEWMQERFFFILPDDDELTVDHILEKAKTTVARYGIRGLVIDPWNEIDHNRPSGLTETEHISQSLGRIRRFARMYQVHVWVVAHPTKLQKDLQGKYPVPTPYDIAGAAHFRNKADCCIAVWRDVSEEDKVVQIHIQKVRFREIGKVGMAELIYNPATGKYKDKIEI